MIEQKYSVGIADNNHSFSVRFPKSTAKSNKSDVISASISFLERGLPTKLHISLAKALADHLGKNLFDEQSEQMKNFMKSDAMKSYFKLLEESQSGIGTIPWTYPK